MGDPIRSYASIGRLNLQVADFREDLCPDEGPTVVRRKSSVRFLDEVTTINDNEACDPERALTRLRSETANHKCSFVAGEPYYSRGMDGGQTASERGSLDFTRWKLDRKEREARLEQNINWIREEITKLKQQDQSLMRQFLQLRSVIYKLKGTVTSDQRPAVKLPHIAASVDSFDRYESNAGGLEALQTGETNDLMLVYDEEGDLCELDDQMALMEDPYLPEFRGRTVSLLGPGNITRTRPGSGGFGYLKSRTMSFSVGTSARELDRAIVE
ncbi:uncharacterized protein LOC110974469 isoform X1 [Acanthaster planci]|uniref:Uncharacterized protein LOC110974469 isoform X1 n=1 Tax=Acanthaster planci TaxID=133434 RepID=A0A8B7XP92_ACAPL|nr:uncharacterized protein LOC110974469 isoform X1 [Acanthaster planci]